MTAALPRSRYDGGTQKTYMAMVQSLDANVGRVLQALDVHGLTTNTIVVFTSDNGGERFSNTWPFSGMKQELLYRLIKAGPVRNMPVAASHARIPGSGIDRTSGNVVLRAGRHFRSHKRGSEHASRQ